MNADVSENTSQNVSQETPFVVIEEDTYVQVSNSNQMSVNLSQYVRKALDGRKCTWNKQDQIHIEVMSDGELRIRKIAAKPGQPA